MRRQAELRGRHDLAFGASHIGDDAAFGHVKRAEPLDRGDDRVYGRAQKQQSVSRIIVSSAAYGCPSSMQPSDSAAAMPAGDDIPRCVPLYRTL